MSETKPVYHTRTRCRTLTGRRKDYISRVYSNWPEEKLEEHGRRLANRLLAVDEVLLRRFGHPILSPSGRGVVKLLVGDL